MTQKLLLTLNLASILLSANAQSHTDHYELAPDYMQQLPEL